MQETQAPDTDGERTETLTAEQRELAARYTGLVAMHLRKRVPTPREPTRDRDYDDLYQEGCIALVRAAARFRPGRDGAFAAYALQRIRGAVHAALHEQFGTIRVPARVQRSSVAARDPARRFVRDLPDDLPAEDSPRGATSGRRDTIRHLLRARFERAVRVALEAQAGSTRDAHRRTALVRIARERLLIAHEDARTSQRVLARACGVSSGRICEYEQRLVERVRQVLREDPQFPLLVRFARTDPRGFQAVLDAAHLSRLQEADERDFRRRFAALEHPQRAECLYRLIAASSRSVAEVATNLYRLTQSNGGAAF